MLTVASVNKNGKILQGEHLPAVSDMSSHLHIRDWQSAEHLSSSACVDKEVFELLNWQVPTSL